MTTTSSRLGRTVLATSHCAGMVDMVALPVWVGTLISRYGFDAQQAGGLVTLFLVGAVLASLVAAPRFNRLRPRAAATAGFGLAALAFFGASTTRDFGTLALLHAVGGVAAGTALSVTHGTVGRCANPHRMFGVINTALGIFAVFFLGATPQIVAAVGGEALFRVFGGVMALATVLAAIGFPQPDAESALSQAFRSQGRRLPGAVWFAVLGVSSLALVQAMVFSFVERMGADRGFGVDRVTAVLIALGIVNMFPAALAALLEKRLNPRTVVLTGPLLQALLALVVTQSAGFGPYAVAAAVFVAVLLFTHTFAFGLLARMDPSGRAVAATPAMIMVGSAIGPILGGTLVKLGGYGALGFAAVAIDVLALLAFAAMARRSAQALAAAAA